MLKKAQVAIIVGAAISILTTFIPSLDFLSDYQEFIVDIIIRLLPIVGGAGAFWLRSETQDSLGTWLDNITPKD